MVVPGEISKKGSKKAVAKATKSGKEVSEGELLEVKFIDLIIFANLFRYKLFLYNSNFD